MSAEAGQRRRTTFAVAAVSGVLVIAACSSSKSTAQTSPATSAPASSSSAGSAPGISSLDATLQKYTDNAPIDLTPLAAKPAAGKKIVFLANSASPLDVKNGQNLTAAANVLGWRTTTINYGGDPATLATAFQQAIAAKPDAIQVDGEPLAAFATSLKAATAAGIPVFEEAIPATATGMDAGGLSGLSLGPKYLTMEGSIQADWILRDSGGKANVATVLLPDFDVLVKANDAFTAEIHKYCPSCKTKVIKTKITDIGRTLPATVTSTLQSDPSIKYLFFPYADMSIGVTSALKTANVKAKLVVTAMNSAQYAEVKAGTIAEGLSTSTEVQGWVIADCMARFFESKKPVNSDIFPAQIFTRANATAPELPISPPDYQDQFKKLWHII